MNKWHILLIVFLTLLAYVNIFQNGFVIDDQYFVQEWQLTRNWSNAGKFILGANPESQQGVYRPIRSLLYLIYFQLFGANLFFYHIHSLVVHLASTVLVFLITKKLIGNWKLEIGNYSSAPFFGALLFGLHPVHTESITYIAASMEMTGVVFFFAAVLAYLREKRIASVILATFAFFTYEMMLTLPILLVLYEVILGKKDFRKTMPYWIAAAAFFAVRFALGVGLARGDYLAYSPYHTWLTMTKMVVKYLWLLVWPVTLSHNHTVVPGFEAFMTPYSDQAAILGQSILDPEILGAIGVIGGIVIIGWKMRKNHPLVSFGIGWFFISILPVLYIFPQGTAIAEKYLYTASFGFVLFLAYSYTQYCKSLKILKVAILTFLILFYGIRTYTRNENWKSPVTLWKHEATIHPKSELAWYTLGVYYAKSGKNDQAIRAYQTALMLKPQMKEAAQNLNNLIQLQKQTP